MLLWPGTADETGTAGPAQTAGTTVPPAPVDSVSPRPAPADRPTRQAAADAPGGLVASADPVKGDGQTSSRPEERPTPRPSADRSTPSALPEPSANLLPPAPATVPLAPPAYVAPTGSGTWRAVLPISRVFDDATKTRVREAIAAAGATLTRQDWNDSTLEVRFEGTIEEVLPKIRQAVEAVGPAVFDATAERLDG